MFKESVSLRKVTWGIAVLALASCAVTTLLLFWSYPFIFGNQWGDHVFYWGQANQWLGLGEPLKLSLKVQQSLDEFRINSYYDTSNGLAQQPPYVYRLMIPLLAGLLGLFLDLSLGFLLIHGLSLFALSFSVGLSVFRLTAALSWSTLGVVMSVALLPGLSLLGRFPALVDLPAIALVALIVWALTRGSYIFAFVLASLSALTKETGTLLGISIVIFAIVSARFKPWMLAAAAIPLVIQLLLRIMIPVPAPQDLTEIFVPGHPYESVLTFVLAFGAATPLVVGLFSRYARPWVLSFAPLIASIAVVTTSVVASGPRIWLVAWPLILVIGLASGWTWAGSLPARVVLATFVILSGIVAQGEVLFGWPRILQTTVVFLFGIWLTVLLISRLTAVGNTGKRTATGKEVSRAEDLLAP